MCGDFADSSISSSTFLFFAGIPILCARRCAQRQHMSTCGQLIQTILRFDFPHPSLLLLWATTYRNRLHTSYLVFGVRVYYAGKILCNPDSSHDVLRLVLACVQLLHRHHVESLAKARASNIEYPLVPHLDVAAAALRCELYLTAFLHVEMFLNAEHQHSSSRNMASSSANSHRPRAAKRARKEIGTDGNGGDDAMAAVAPLLREICKHLHEPDTILGVPADYSAMRGPGERVSTYDILGQSRR